MKKILGILLMVMALYFILIASQPAARSLSNHRTLGRDIGTMGILVLGVAPLIISGGIDLSIGSVVGLCAVVFALLINTQQGPGIPPFPAAALILLGVPLIGLIHGLLVTMLRLQPFLATLCGLFIYRGLARWVTRLVMGAPQDVGLAGTTYNMEAIETLAEGNVPVIGIPYVLLIFLGLSILVGIFLHASTHGRYIYAIGANEQAARYAGIATNRYKIAMYMWCSLMAGLYGIVSMLQNDSASPANSGTWLELYAITGAVLGGCSLRGGDGTIIGIILGAAILPLLRKVVLFVGIPDDVEFAVLGLALLLGTIVDETLKRQSAARV